MEFRRWGFGVLDVEFTVRDNFKRFSDKIKKLGFRVCGSRFWGFMLTIRTEFWRI